MTISCVPGPDTPIAPQILEHADGPVTLIWGNEAGGITARLDPPSPTSTRNPRFIKWNPASTGLSLKTEAARLSWLAGRHRVPTVLKYLQTDDGELLITEAVVDKAGNVALSAVAPRWVAEPDVAIRAIGQGLRVLHSLPTKGCPFSWSVADRLTAIKTAGVSVPDDLYQAPPVDQLVVCHGDACAPNTLLSSTGRFEAHVDMEMLGLADRWADLAVATMSLAWNYPTYDESVFWDAYGIAPEEERIAYYRKLWDAG